MHINYVRKNSTAVLYSPMGELAGKRVDNYLNALANEVQAAIVLAEKEDATPEDITDAENKIKRYEQEIRSYQSASKKKKGSFFGKLKTLQERKIKILAKLKLPTFQTHAKGINRRERLESIKFEQMRLAGMKPTKEVIEQQLALASEATYLAKKEKQYLKQGKIVVAIVSVVIGIFTFGGGAIALQGAFQALKQGAIEAAKKILIAAITSALAKGVTKKDAAKSYEVVNDLEKYPPDTNLTSLDDMLADSQNKKMQAKNTGAGLLIPAGLIALITLYS